MDGEGGRHDGLVALVVPFVRVTVVLQTATVALRGPAIGDHGGG